MEIPGFSERLRLRQRLGWGVWRPFDPRSWRERIHRECEWRALRRLVRVRHGGSWALPLLVEALVRSPDGAARLAVEFKCHAFGGCVAAVGTYLRVDLFASDRGVLFNEFSSLPGGGAGFTAACDASFGAAWQEHVPQAV